MPTKTNHRAFGAQFLAHIKSKIVCNFIEELAEDGVTQIWVGTALEYARDLKNINRKIRLLVELDKLQAEGVELILVFKDDQL
jgi:hypothetical protein